MTGPVHIPLDAVVPAPAEILHAQGIPRNAAVRDNVRAMAGKSLELFSAAANPRCVAADISPRDFDAVFRGAGLNDPEAPLKEIYPRAEHLVLFALTMGQEVSRRIEEHFQDDDFALGSMLDAAASLAVENSVEYLEHCLARERAGAGDAPSGRAVLNYSPGYCGWHISAQREVFRFLHPERIGIGLTNACLMTPLKSATGVLVHGEKSIHDFEGGFGFCNTCQARTCLERRARP